jgi:hypothetical protein
MAGRKRLLLIMSQPPGCSGVQALIYHKQMPFYERHGWDIHFAGPAPWLSSVITEPLSYPADRLHYTTRISPSLCFSIRKNRQRKGSLPYLFFGGLQLLAQTAERLLRHDREAFLLKGLETTVRQAEQRWAFDLLAGKTPDFRVLQLAHRLSQELGKPFVALVDDPYGARDESGFYPTTPELQAVLLAEARATLFMSPLTRERYVGAGLVAERKAHFLSDSYPVEPELYRKGRSPLAQGTGGRKGASELRLVYLGMLPEWRPIEPLLEALSAAARQEGPQSAGLRLAIYGFVYGSARQRIGSDPSLASIVQIQPLVSYAASHALAEDADVQLVVIGPRHLDNYPSKFFDYLAHHKPLLILGPPQNPLRQLVQDLQIGLYVDGRSAPEILAALRSLRANYGAFQRAYSRQAAELEAFSAPRVAQRFCGLLDQALDPS